MTGEESFNVTDVRRFVSYVLLFRPLLPFPVRAGRNLLEGVEEKSIHSREKNPIFSGRNYKLELRGGLKCGASASRITLERGQNAKKAKCGFKYLETLRMSGEGMSREIPSV